ncbi:DUF6573 family protein [Rhodococcus artemisiae]|uniref:Uncharacterized protein n=1 Tax=Rhodococcus artemisiae TaxID=714159 RepID=A0ABU7LJ18_9NOCA|nr:DUF6573 family protein [Rhodococcus artemisiae]MEE2061565.1 hypothetical protein [Rhodococcus artemisiae]
MTDLLTDTRTAAATRAEAIARGSLRDVTTDARHFGILLPTAITHRAWKQAIAWPDRGTAARWEAGRTGTVLAHAARALLRAQARGREGLQLFNFIPTPSPDGEDLLTLAVEIGPGDAGEPVVTITAATDH